MCTERNQISSRIGQTIEKTANYRVSGSLWAAITPRQATNAIRSGLRLVAILVMVGLGILQSWQNPSSFAAGKNDQTCYTVSNQPMHTADVIDDIIDIIKDIIGGDDEEDPEEPRP